MNSGNSKTFDPHRLSHRLLLNFSDKINLKRSDKCIALSNLSISYTWKSIKKSYEKNKFKIFGPTWNKKFELPDESDIRDYFEYIIKKHETFTDNPLIRLYVNKIENRITFKIKTE